jgi:cell division protein FtsN
MSAHDRTVLEEKHRSRRPWHGYGPLTVGWLLVLATAALAGWFVHTSAPGPRPVHTATLYTGALPNPQEAAAPTAAAEEIDPRLRQFAARDPLTTAPRDSGAGAPSAAVDPSPARVQQPPQPDEMSETSIPAIPVAAEQAGAPGPQVARGPAANQLAALSDALQADAAGAGPLPPPVPRSIVATTSAWPASDTAARYSVQVGAFRMRENAVARAARLSEAGYDVRIVHAFATHSRLYMVRLGAFEARPAAMAYARRLSQDVGVETWPVRN